MSSVCSVRDSVCMQWARVGISHERVQGAAFPERGVGVWGIGGARGI